MAGTSKLAGLKGVAFGALAVGRDEVSLRRQKLLTGLRTQLAAAKQAQQGQRLMVTRMRKIKNAAGIVETVAVQRPVKPWFFSDIRGKWYLQIRYGNRPLPIAEGKDTIEVGSQGALAGVIETVTEAVLAGELDKLMQESALNRQRKAKREEKVVS